MIFFAHLCIQLTESGTINEGKHVNGARAAKLLKVLPTSDPVYERHSSKLYRLRYLEKFPQVQGYLDDQKTQDYSAKIDQIAAVMKTNLEKSSAGVNIINPNYDTDLGNAKADIDSLSTWAKNKRLYWAFMLLYWVQKSSLPNWYAQYTTGTTSSSLGMYIKTLNGTFGVLEDNQVNMAGHNFMQAFNQSIQIFQMTAIIPQLVDLDGNLSNFDSLLKDCLYEFWNHYKDSQDQTMTDHVQAALKLYQDDAVRRDFYMPLVTFQKLGGAGMNWGHITQMWTATVGDSLWFQALQWGATGLKLMGVLASSVMMFIPLMAGGIDNLEPAVMASWIG